MTDVRVARLLLIRHAATDAVGAVLAGRSEGWSLNVEGRAEAVELASALERLQVACVYTSPRARALETAVAISSTHAVIPVILPELDEVDYGVWTGRAFEELDRDPRWRSFNASREFAQAPGGERFTEVRVRARALLQRVRTWHAGETVVAVTHAEIVRIALAEATGMNLDAAARFIICPASISSLALWPGWVEVTRLNQPAASLIAFDLTGCRQHVQAVNAPLVS